MVAFKLRSDEFFLFVANRKTTGVDSDHRLGNLTLEFNEQRNVFLYFSGEINLQLVVVQVVEFPSAVLATTD